MREDSATLAPETGETTIGVALGDRSYDIVIGKHLLDGAGARIAAALPGARCAVVSDETVAALYLDRLKASLAQGSFSASGRSPGEQSKSFPVLADVCEQLLKLGSSAAMWSLRLAAAWSATLRALPRASPPRRPLRADPHDPARPGRLLGGRQDRHRHAARQEPDRRLPPAEPGARRHRGARDAARRANSAPATPRS